MGFILVHPLVGQDADVFYLRAVRRVKGAAAAGADVQLLPVDDERLRQDIFDPLGPLGAEFLADGSVNDEGKLIAADAERVVRAPHTAPQPPGHSLEQLVAHIVAVGVVDGFEAVQIQIEQRKRLPGLLLFLQGRIEESLVGKAGQAGGKLLPVPPAQNEDPS